MLALHVGRLRLTRVPEGVVVDPYADKMGGLARMRHGSNQNYANDYLRAIWNRLYDCMDCNCDKCSGIRRWRPSQIYLLTSIYPRTLAEDLDLDFWYPALVNDSHGGLIVC
jgi:hypothetical protein